MQALLQSHRGVVVRTRRDSSGSGGNRKVQARGVAPTAFSYETQRLVKVLATRQALKTVLNYLSETNGEQHLWLHNYIADNALPLGGDADADEWIARLASTPLTRVSDPRRSSVPSVAAAAAVLDGEREVSPRDVADRVLALRAHIALEMAEVLAGMDDANAAVRRRCARGLGGGCTAPVCPTKQRAPHSKLQHRNLNRRTTHDPASSHKTQGARAVGDDRLQAAPAVMRTTVTIHARGATLCAASEMYIVDIGRERERVCVCLCT